ncbi:hypothetical protein KAU43_06330 [candidate division WOR-3 bacterium]|nr:hypothetical protein [candidate division WOR-3 bacterium]
MKKIIKPSYVKYTSYSSHNKINKCPNCEEEVSNIQSKNRKIIGYVYCNNCKIILRDTIEVMDSKYRGKKGFEGDLKMAFEKGNKVKVVSKDSMHDGKEGEITELWGEGRVTTLIEGHEVWHDEDELELISQD